MGRTVTVLAANAHRWIVEAAIEPEHLRVTFANGDRFRLPLVRLGDPGRMLARRISIAADGMSIEIPAVPGGETLEVPWDFIRAECDPTHADRTHRESDSTAAAVGGKIARLRRARGWTQAALGARARIARATVNRIERGRLLAEVSTLDRIARAFGTSLARLITS